MSELPLEPVPSSAGASDLVDAAGTCHRPARPRPRIVSLVPSITETLFDLGLDEAVSAAPPSVSARAAG